jgi:hypothetical protein
MMMDATSSPSLELAVVKGHFVALLDVVVSTRIGGFAVTAHELRLAVDEFDSRCIHPVPWVALASCIG